MSALVYHMGEIVSGLDAAKSNKWNPWQCELPVAVEQDQQMRLGI